MHRACAVNPLWRWREKSLSLPEQVLISTSKKKKKKREREIYFWRSVLSRAIEVTDPLREKWNRASHFSLLMHSLAGGSLFSFLPSLQKVDWKAISIARKQERMSIAEKSHRVHLFFEEKLVLSGAARYSFFAVKGKTEEKEERGEKRIERRNAIRSWILFSFLRSFGYEKRKRKERATFFPTLTR